MATRVVSRVRNALGIDLSVRAVFDAPTVAQLSHSLAGDRLSLLYAIPIICGQKRDKGYTGNA
jgi:hypothetical protein